MEIHQVRYFLALCETLNFTRAAESCSVSQPALTRAVHKLEEELGGLLLRREHNLTHLTDFGRLVRPHREQMMAQAEAAKSTAKHFLRMDSAPINLGNARDPVGAVGRARLLVPISEEVLGCHRRFDSAKPAHRDRQDFGRFVSPQGSKRGVCQGFVTYLVLDQNVPRLPWQFLERAG